ncbi:hypothetical protein K458DRAFT_375424 [Lentithecium fluviatile CBS 122367]|uniref:DUF676 domain-containing protein n=1 Tax=Lentithecium fluviatile CBS 122367 TaxID=1168545 RepID=A0A6G1IM11_9PLEO|nr:hypothetical protein K458DRAFT_375424 [Lentithecium fluviatile CBS 122367]
MPRSPLSFLKGRTENSHTSSGIQSTANNMSESTGSMALATQPSTALVDASLSASSSDPVRENLETTDGRFGIQTVSSPANADMDIWFVHGLTGDRESTWTHSNGTFTPDLMQTQFPTARIITYGYDANIVGLWKNASGDGLRGHGKALAYAISNSQPNEAERPLFFIVHSLGGLVTEQALLFSLEPNEPRLHSIASRTAGIIFMGTPHSGSYLATWGYTLARLLDRIWRTNKELLSLLKQRSEVLKAVEEIFQRQLTTSGELSHVKVFCFYETVAVDVVGFVVPEESATMLPHPNCGINANHMDMTKFTSGHDAGFISVKGVFNDWIRQRAEQSTTEANDRTLGVEPAATLTFNNGPIKAHIVQQGSGNAGRDICHGNVTNQSAGRDWINGDHIMYKKPKSRRATDRDGSDDDE